MSFYEDDRIRNKNKLHNEAYMWYEALKANGYSSEYIVSLCNTYINVGITHSRNNIYSTVLKIVGSTFNEGSD